ncbi:MAG: dipeptide epimerase [Candidatus Riflebacteria bacterium]|nr:dipeptide epimerase [Candidatus Riflebacteria bacterium]
MRLESDLDRFQVTTQPLRLTLVDPFTIARGTETVRQNVLVRVRYRGGEGLGESSPSQRYGETDVTVMAAVARAAERLADMRPDVDVLGHALDRCLGERDCSARSGLEMALLDAIGRLGGLAAYQLLGLEPPRPIETSFTIAIAAPEEMARRARAAAECGLLKVKLGASSDIDGLEAVRQARPDARLMADANEGWDVDTALGHLPRLAALGVEWLEQPLPAGQEHLLGRLRGRGVRVMADESLVTPADLERLAGQVDGINVKVTKVGGMTRAVKLLSRGRELGMTTMLGCMIESSLGIGSAVEISSLADLADLDGQLLIRDDPFDGVRCERGWLTRREGPGLAVSRRGAARG